ncbi:MAG: extracellular solute-binding protein [Candidatus Ozemobacteraceae bacterium]
MDVGTGEACNQREFRKGLEVKTPLRKPRILGTVMVFLILGLSCCHAASITLNFWITGGEGKLFESVARAFEAENPDIKVCFQSFSWGLAFEKLVTSVIGGTTPDICQMGTTWMPRFQAMDALLPLDELLADSTVRASDFFAGAWKTCELASRTWGIPWYVETRVMYYLKSLRKDYNLSHLPETWKEFIDLGKRVMANKRQRGQKGYFYSFPRNDMTLMKYYWQCGGTFSLESPEHCGLSQEPFFEAARYMKSFYDLGFAPFAEDTGVEYTAEFVSGYYPVTLGGPWLASDLEIRQPQAGDLWETALLPKNKTRTSFVGGSNLVIFRQTAHVAAAWKLMQFLSRPDIQARWFELSKDLPSNHHAWEFPALTAHPALATFKEQLNDTNFPPPIPEWETIADRFCQILERMMHGDTSIEQGFHEINQKARELLSQRNRTSPMLKKTLLAFLLAILPLILITAYLWNDEGGSSHGGFDAVPFLAPALLLILLFRLTPLLISLVVCFTDWDMFGIANLERVNFIGLDNFLRLMNDEIFRAGVWNTLWYLLAGVPLNICLALGTALVVDQASERLKPFLRVSFFLPAIVTTVAAATVWKWLFSLNSPLAEAFRLLGFSPIAWLSDPFFSLPSLILFSVWKGFGYNMIIFLAALANVPRQLLEAVEVDGGNWWHQFRYVILPSLSRTLIFVFVTTVAGNIHFFIEPYIMTGGGPLNSTMSVMLYTYQQGFKFFHLGYASSMIYSLFLFFCLFNFAQKKLRGLVES